MRPPAGGPGGGHGQHMGQLVGAAAVLTGQQHGLGCLAVATELPGDLQVDVPVGVVEDGQQGRTAFGAARPGPPEHRARELFLGGVPRL